MYVPSGPATRNPREPLLTDGYRYVAAAPHTVLKQQQPQEDCSAVVVVLSVLLVFREDISVISVNGPELFF